MHHSLTMSRQLKGVTIPIALATLVLAASCTDNSLDLDPSPSKYTGVITVMSSGASAPVVTLGQARLTGTTQSVSDLTLVLSAGVTKVFTELRPGLAVGAFDDLKVGDTLLVWELSVDEQGRVVPSQLIVANK
jgi:hypothetical protein